jgi:hypothetical protein
MIDTMRDVAVDLQTRADMAKAAAPYMHPSSTPFPLVTGSSREQQSYMSL